MQSEEIFLRGAWKSVPDEENIDWIYEVAQQDLTDEPLGDFGPLVKEMLDKGVEASKIARFAKLIGYESLFSFCWHLQDSSESYADFSDSGDQIEWMLYQIDSETERPIHPMQGLHEMVLSMDPTGREMRP